MLKQENKPEIIDGNEKYRTHSKIAILSVLRLMVRSRSLATCYFGESGSFFLTTILSVDAHQNEMVMDCGADGLVNEKALRTSDLSIVAFPNKVKIQFMCQKLRKTLFEGKEAFLVEVPESLLQIQKREYYRIATPIVSPVKCVIPLLQNISASSVDVVLQNISCGGMAFLDYGCEAVFEKGPIYPNCRIMLPEMGTLKASIRVTRVELQRVNDIPRQRVSCEYVDVDDITLSLIQRYINKLEVEKRK
jgi:c-di-GMP-binding flagellar brake protein YcgR